MFPGHADLPNLRERHSMSRGRTVAAGMALAESPERLDCCPRRSNLRVIPRLDELDSSGLGQARAALEHFQRVMRQHVSKLVRSICRLPAMP
jgi:hypothetical protein